MQEKSIGIKEKTKSGYEIFSYKNLDPCFQSRKEKIPKSIHNGFRKTHFYLKYKKKKLTSVLQWILYLHFLK